MGQEIKKTDFTKEDIEKYKTKLKLETELLEQWFSDQKFARATPHIGLELEGWLVDDNSAAAPRACEFLNHASHPDIVPELALFNFEINFNHYKMNSELFTHFKNELGEKWAYCQEKARLTNCHALMIGSLPSLSNELLTLDNISPYNRYYALNEQIMKLREQRPIEINIAGDEQLKYKYDSILLEGAATSMQIHLEVSQEDAVAFYNASILASPFLVGICANSSFLCEKSLWHETRIPVFEQTVIVGVNEEPLAKKRVTLGTGYLKDSLFELFQENESLYPPLIPHVCDSPASEMNHVNFHNGTIWRWNRPIIGFNPDGQPSLRIEHRVIPAGPSCEDTLANIMLFLGLVHTFKESTPLMLKQIPFEDNYINLYAASKNGINAEFIWKNGKAQTLQKIFLNELYPQIRKTLTGLQFSEDDIVKYFDHNIKERVTSKMNGAQWQRSFVEKYGRDYHNLVLNYRYYQEQNLPVHLWPVEKKLP